MQRSLLAIALACFALPASAAMVEKPVEWKIGGDSFTGTLVYDDATDAKRPGLMMVPNWRGVTQPSVEHAKNLAGDDYVILVADVYGTKVRPQSNEEAGEVAGQLKADPATLRTRAQKAVEVLKAQAGKAPVDPERIGAIGFCFGGTTVLELVRAGADLAGAVSLHGGLSTPKPAQESAIETPVLVLNGAADKAVTDAEIDAFEQEMDRADADWQFVNFGGAVHCFAEPSAGNDPASNCRYSEQAATRAYGMMADFFRRQFTAAE
ncbi:dienelactone hydrolase family protein [Lysobacter korlensis]|uniref:Dienelactone hydrolase family protein n=1 Tax=Lysobacter korlensis TaxID=553636 RepID=A0ABV6RQJ0_9GAMM